MLYYDPAAKLLIKTLMEHGRKWRGNEVSLFITSFSGDFTRSLRFAIVQNLKAVLKI